MSRDPRIDPWPGDVLRWSVRGIEVVARVESFDSYTLTTSGAPSERRLMMLHIWRDWTTVDGGRGGVVVVHAARVADA